MSSRRPLSRRRLPDREFDCAAGAHGRAGRRDGRHFARRRRERHSSPPRRNRERTCDPPPVGL